MTDQVIGVYQATVVEEQGNVEGTVGRRRESYLTFLGLAFLLIMPLGIVFHPEWLATVAEIGTLVAAVSILRLTLVPKQ
ncbi:hypothetical protein [Azospirillum sp. TSO22-1]|uniref:hypothetical protein n=1 Tax=Azospirillum sp. TSO22-1 TaxID=716789 RepID=UPI000D61FAFA|nr:hypothetical protein [Azospirillum sp. TSO22-1]PWC55501.1 hypothetical protein TSO221_04250 [Azospirillum sp. TSO22-1]